MVAPLLARQFCQLQALGQEHGQNQQGIPHVILETPVTTPLVVSAWEAALSTHPDRRWVESLLRGMREGFRIGLSNPRCQSSRGNAPSADANAQVVSAFIDTQIRAGYMIGPLQPQDCSGVTVSQMAVIPKKTPGKWRVIREF